MRHPQKRFSKKNMTTDLNEHFNEPISIGWLRHCPGSGRCSWPREADPHVRPLGSCLATRTFQSGVLLGLGTTVLFDVWNVVHFCWDLKKVNSHFNIYIPQDFLRFFFRTGDWDHFRWRFPLGCWSRRHLFCFLSMLISKNNMQICNPYMTISLLLQCTSWHKYITNTLTLA